MSDVKILNKDHQSNIVNVAGTEFTFDMDPNTGVFSPEHPLATDDITDGVYVYLDSKGFGRVRIKGNNIILMKEYKAGLQGLQDRIANGLPASFIPIDKIDSQYYGGGRKANKRYKASNSQPTKLDEHIQEKQAANKIRADKDLLNGEFETAYQAGNIQSLDFSENFSFYVFYVTKDNNISKTKYALKRYLLSKYNNIWVTYKDDGQFQVGWK